VAAGTHHGVWLLGASVSCCASLSPRAGLLGHSFRKEKMVVATLLR